MSQDKINPLLKNAQEKADNLVTMLKTAVRSAELFTEELDKLREQHNLTPFEFCISLVVAMSTAEKVFPLEIKKAKQLMGEKIVDGKFERGNNDRVDGRDEGEAPKT